MTIEKIDKTISILIADDHTLTRDMIRSILRQLGFQNLLTVDDGKKAFEELQRARYDLVISDWNMPTCSGIELLRAMRADKAFREIPFLMLTAEAYRENVVEAVKAGASDYISKPFTAQTLSEKVAKIMRGRTVDTPDKTGG